ncbi:hypothetical protein ACP275_11G068600 [Erythranthe tilingii]
MRVLNFMWWIPLKVMKSGASLLNLESRNAETKNPRRRPLHTCGSTCLAMAHKACAKAQDLDGPFGTTAKRAIAFATFFTPLIYGMLRQWLSMLSFIDDQILIFERMAEIVFPPCTPLFDKIDSLLCSAETLPENLDNIIQKFPTMIHNKFPFLDWILVHLISRLNCLLSILTHFGSRSTGDTREKEIKIDVMNSNENSNNKNIYNKSEEMVEDEKSSLKSCEVLVQKPVTRLDSLKKRLRASLDPDAFRDADNSPMYSSYQSANSSPVSDYTQFETYPFSQTGRPDSMNCSYKEVLEKGKKEDEDTVEDNSTTDIDHTM